MLSNRERPFRDLLLHEFVKPYLDGLILIRDVETGGSHPLTSTDNFAHRPRSHNRLIVAQFIARRP